MSFNFDKTDTLNQMTSYDYDSIMHYNRSVNRGRSSTSAQRNSGFCPTRLTICPLQAGLLQGRLPPHHGSLTGPQRHLRHGHADESERHRAREPALLRQVDASLLTSAICLAVTTPVTEEGFTTFAQKGRQTHLDFDK